MISSCITNGNQTEIEEKDDEDISENSEVISTKDALQKIRDLQRFFMSKENTKDVDFDYLSKLESAILIRNINFKQHLISDFFSPSMIEIFVYLCQTAAC